MNTPFCPAPSLSSQIAGTRNRLYRVALAWCGDAMLADDLVQETLSTGIARRQQLRDEKRLYAWLFSILNNVWNQHLRKMKPNEDLDDQIPSGNSGPSSQCQELELVEYVRRAVAALPIKERQVISLVDLDELSYCEVAGALDIPIGTVMSRLYYARKHLLDKLERLDPGSGKTGSHIQIVK